MTTPPLINKDKDEEKVPKKPHFFRSFFERLRAYFIAGVLITAPISFTLFIALTLVRWIDDAVTRLIPPQWNPELHLPVSVPGLGIVIVVIGLIIVGMLTAGFVGRIWLRFSEYFLARLPVVRGIYGATKQVLETVLANQSKAFREACLIEYSRKGVWMVGFITGETEGEIQKLTNERVYNVFVPTTPNPTSGFLVYIPDSQLVRLQMKVDDAIKMVISGGIVTPPAPQSVPENILSTKTGDTK